VVFGQRGAVTVETTLKRWAHPLTGYIRVFVRSSNIGSTKVWLVEDLDGGYLVQHAEGGDGPYYDPESGPDGQPAWEWATHLALENAGLNAKDATWADIMAAAD